MTDAAAHILQAWSGVFRSPVITELTPRRVWEVATERGDRYVLKKVSTFGAPDRARRFTDEARILGYLLQRGVPVAVPVLSDEGKAYAADDAGAPYAVFPMFSKGEAGDDPGLDPALYRNVGAAVARMHVALAGCPFGIDSWEVGPALFKDWWQTAESRLPAVAFSELSADIRPHRDEIIQALSAPPQRVHGDVHGGNLLTSGQEVTGIIDCDHLQMAPRAYDLGYYMAFGVQWRLEGNAPAQPLQEAIPLITRHLLAGYNAIWPLTEQENQDLPALALVTALGLIEYFITLFNQVEESWLRTIHWIVDNYDALRLPASP